MATVVAIAMERSGGQHAYIRAIVYCGLGGMVTYNMLGGLSDSLASSHS